MGSILISFIDLVANLILWIIFINFILQFFLAPFHPARDFLNRILEPMLSPLRQIIPPSGGLDFSPMVLIILVILLRALLTTLVASIYY